MDSLLYFTYTNDSFDLPEQIKNPNGDYIRKATNSLFQLLKSFHQKYLLVEPSSKLRLDRQTQNEQENKNNDNIFNYDKQVSINMYNSDIYNKVITSVGLV